MNSINVQKRDLSVKAKKMRHLGLVPGNVFGKSLPGSISIQMDKKECTKIGSSKSRRQQSFTEYRRTSVSDTIQGEDLEYIK